MSPIASSYSIKATSLLGVKEISSNFVNVRQWNKFHTPTNLVLALSGECGEVCEIFQWKTLLPHEKQKFLKSFTEEEITHIGEEISDVFIYTTRLCDVCHIDVPQAVSKLLNIHTSDSDIVLENLQQIIAEQLDNENINVRAFVLDLQSKAGQLCSLFSSNKEALDLKSWNSQTQVLEFSAIVANIIVLLAKLANCFDISLSQCISRKFSLNDAKYPVELVQGSSAKYTTYSKQLKGISFETIGGSMFKYGLVIGITAVICFYIM